MNKHLTQTGIILLLLVPIAALAADAAKPTASAVQSAAWTTADYLRAALSGAAGGLISGLVALVIGWMNNRNALKLNQQKIDADTEALRINYQNQINKLCYEEKKQICTALLTELSEFNIFQRNFNITKAILLYTKTIFTCPTTYSEHAFELIQLVACDTILRKALDNNAEKFVEKNTAEVFLKRVGDYNKFYKIFVIITQKMLAGEDLLPPTKWNLDDFEGSVPLDYRKLLS